MNNIALVGENELQRGLRASYENLMGVNGAPVGVTATGNLADVTNDKGLTIEKSNAAGAHGVTAGVRNQIGAPTVSGDRVGELLDNLEQAIAFLQVENDEKSSEVALKRSEQSRKACGKKFAAQLDKIRTQANELPDGKDAGQVIGKVFKGIGACFAVLGAIAVSVASGGAASGLIVAAALSVASFAADASGGFEEMQKAISKSLQENNGYTKEEADRAAGYIAMSVQLLVEIASAVAGCVPNPQQELSMAMNKVADKTAQMTAEEVNVVHTVAAEKLIRELGDKGASKFTTAAKLVEQAKNVNKIEQVTKCANTALSIVQTVSSTSFQFNAIKVQENRGKVDADAIRTESDMEAMQEVLSECEGDIEAALGRIARKQGKVEKILASRSESIDKINNEFGGLA